HHLLDDFHTGSDDRDLAGDWGNFATCFLSAAGSFLDFDDDSISRECAGVSGLEFIHLGLDGVEVLTLHDVDDFDLLLEALERRTIKVSNEGKSTSSPETLPSLTPPLWS